MKNTKVKIAVLAVMAAASLAGAEISFSSARKYVKGSLGYGFRTVELEYETDVPYSSGDERAYYLYDSSNLATKTVKHKADYGFGFFTVDAGFGMFLFESSSNEFLQNLALEASLGLGFGGNDSVFDATLVNPTFMGIYNFKLSGGAKKIVPFAGAGFSVPIFILDCDYDGFDKVNAGFSVNLTGGCGYDFTEKIRGTADYMFSFGTSLGSTFRVSVMYFL